MSLPSDRFSTGLADGQPREHPPSPFRSLSTSPLIQVQFPQGVPPFARWTSSQ